MSFTEINKQQTLEKIAEGGMIIIDIRDPASFQEQHIMGALNLNPQTLNDFIHNNDKNQPVLVYCYRGNSSKAIAHYLSEQGFSTVYSLEGGFTAW